MAYFEIWNLLVCYGMSFILTQAHISDFLRYSIHTNEVGEKGFTTRYIYPFTSCIMCVGFWIAFFFAFFYRGEGFTYSLEFAFISAAFNYFALTVTDRLER